MSPVQPTYPGVYIEEIPSGARTITGVSTSIAAFIGLASYGGNKTDEKPDEGITLPSGEVFPSPIRIGSYSVYQRRFGPPHPDSDLATSVRLFFLNGGSICYVVNISDDSSRASVKITDGADDVLELKANQIGEKGNNVKVETKVNTDDSKVFTVIIRYKVKETIIEKERFIECTMDEENENYIAKMIAESQYITCTVLKPSVPANESKFLVGGNNNSIPDDIQGNYEQAIKALDFISDLNIIVITKLSGMNDEVYRALLTKVSRYSKDRRAFLLIDPITTWKDVPKAKTGVTDIRKAVYKEYSAVYFPQIEVREYDSEKEDYINKTMGPAAAVAGIFARIDTQRGIWKAPAGNEAYIIGVERLELNLTDKQNGVLNPEGINCIRAFPTGTVCWGARTVAGYESGDWKYIPVRRLALFIEETLFRNTKWVVFKPNDEPTWASIRSSIKTFMLGLFEAGAFQGDSPSKAFYVKCDAETTTQADRDNGIVNIEVGFAPLKPAEFVIIKIQQYIEQT